MSCSCYDSEKLEMISFMLFKSIPGLGKIFEEVPESTVQPGDIVLFPLDKSYGNIRHIFKHAAVCCGDGEVIHLQKYKSDTNYCRISKEGFEIMKRERGTCQIYRKLGKINLDDFRRRVKEAMNCVAEYDLLKNNCIHFALWLLGLEKFSAELVQSQDKISSDGTVEIKNEDSSEVAATCSSSIPALQWSCPMM